MTVTEVFSKQAGKCVNVTVAGKNQKKPLLELIAIKHLNQAAMGDVKSAALVLGVLKPPETNQDNNLPELINQFLALHASREAADRARPRPADDDEPEDDPEKE